MESARKEGSQDSEGLESLEMIMKGATEQHRAACKEMERLPAAWQDIVEGLVAAHVWPFASGLPPRRVFI